MKIYLPGKLIQVADVIEAVAAEYGFTPEQLTGERGNQQLAFARHLAMHIAYNVCNKSLQRIGFEFGGRDHSTVIHARKNIQKCLYVPRHESDRMKAQREDLLRMIERIESKLKQDKP